MAERKLKTNDDLTWRDIETGAVITEAGNASARRTGDWRAERPVVDKEKCIKCGLCWLHCPDAAMKHLEDGYYEPDLYYCKGCGICAQICPRKAITMIEEEEI
ncbi:MAG: 4Fe-4S binding protein [Chloroflexota bacterium]|nr:4Fe-4S binding protein [Chloroflexota bacterium]